MRSCHGRGERPLAGVNPWGPSPKAVQALERRIEAAGGTTEFYTYPGAGHWFVERDQADAYDVEAAELAWQRTLAFLRPRLCAEG